MRPIVTILMSGSLLAVTGATTAADIEVMTQNQYVGFDLISLVTAPDFNAAVIEGLQTRAASLPEERMHALAALIAKRDPALVGLQEVYEFTCLELPAPVADGKGCDNPSIEGAFGDQLDDTLEALGGRYAAAATVVNLDLPAGLGIPGLPGIPLQIDGMTVFLGVVDRDVILARADVAHQVTNFQALNAYDPNLCPLPSADGCNYQQVASAPLTIPLPGGGSVTIDVDFQRGFVGVDALVGGLPYRFVNTHLETRLESFGMTGRFIQSAQAAELLATIQYMPGAPGQKTLLVGDFNSDPRDSVYPVPPGYPEFLGVPPYLQATMGAGFTDVWTRRPGTKKAKGAPLVGYSCCQEEDLSNHRSDLYERIDLILSLTAPRKVFNARLLGESVSDKTMPGPSGLWPSDHATVAARLRF